MKYIVKFVVLTFFCFAITNIHAEEKIAFIDMKKVLNESNAGKKAQDYLISTHKSNIKNFKKIEESLKKEENDLLSKKNVLKLEDYNKKASGLREKVQKYQSERTSKLEQISLKRAEAKSKLLKAVQPILSDYSAQNGISLIIDKQYIVLGKSENDITNIVIEKLNKKIPSLKLK